MRIGIGGFQHETNTFAPSRAAWEDFADKGGGWPRLVSGPAMFQAVAGANIPVAGFIEAMGAHTLLPATWAAASPSGPVTRDAYERISALILQGLSAAMPLDGVYLDLHGAMVAEHLDDGEGELLRRVRERVGPDVPVVASLDLHANMTARCCATPTRWSAIAPIRTSTWPRPGSARPRCSRPGCTARRAPVAPCASCRI